MEKPTAKLALEALALLSKAGLCRPYILLAASLGLAPEAQEPLQAHSWEPFFFGDDDRENYPTVHPDLVEDLWWSFNSQGPGNREKARAGLLEALACKLTAAGYPGEDRGA